MSTFRNPVGPQPSNVYWRRRLIVGIGALAVIVIILLIVFAPKGDKSPTAAESSSPAVAPSSTSTADSSDLPACNVKDLVVTAVVDKSVYTVEETPQLSFSIKNNGKVDCGATAGTDVQIFTVTSGKETIWSSADCQTDPTPNVATLEAGAEVSSASIAWDRTRSSKSTCDSTRPAATAGGASYHLEVSVNGVASTNSPQFSLK